MLQTAEKGDDENWVIYLVSMFPSRVMVLKLSKKVHFLQFCAEISKKISSISRREVIINNFSHRNARVTKLCSNDHIYNII